MRSAPVKVRAGEVRAGEVRAGEVNGSDVALCVPAPDHRDGGLNVGPRELFVHLVAVGVGASCSMAC